MNIFKKRSAPKQSQTEETSEFGKGYSYCLGLFLAHEWAMFHAREKAKQYPAVYTASMWFNGAADHLFELEIPAQLPKDKKNQIKDFRDRCIKFRLCMGGERCDWSDAAAALNESKDLLREWDVFNKVSAIKGSWQ